MGNQKELNQVEQPKKMPEKTFRAGGVVASVWQNDRTIQQGNQQIKVSFETVQIERTYKDKAGEWKKTSTFRKNDLPKVALVAQKAFEYVTLNRDDTNDNNDVQD